MPLVDSSLVVRYPLDEAATGNPATLEDIGPNNYDLTAQGTNLNANFEYAEVSSNRGLSCSSTTGDQRCRRTVGNTGDAVRTAMAGGKKYTIEAVIDPTAFNSSNSRIIALQNRVGSNPEFGLTAAGTTDYRIYYNQALIASFNPGTVNRFVAHIVIDTDEVDGADRVKLSLNGGSFSSIGNGTLNPSETLTLNTNLDLILFNRESSGTWDRSWSGTLFWAAIHATNLSLANCQNNHGIITLDDDTPAAAGGQTVSPSDFAAKTAFGTFVLTTGAVTISPDSLVGRLIYGAFSVALGAAQTVEPGSAVAKGAHGSFTLTPGAVVITCGDLVAKVAAGAFTVTPGGVTLTLNGLVARGVQGAVNIVLIISPDSATARVTLGNITVAPGVVTLNQDSIVVRTVYGDFIVTRVGDAAPQVLHSRVIVDFSPRI